MIIVLEIIPESLGGLIFEFETVDEKEHAAGVAGAEEELDHRSGNQGFAGTGGHLEEEAVLALPDGALDRLDGGELIGPEKAELVVLDERLAPGFIEPGGIAGVFGHLGQSDIVAAGELAGEFLQIGLEFGYAGDSPGRGEAGDQLGIAAFGVPEIVEVAVGEDDEAAVLGTGVLARLLLAEEGILVCGLGLEDNEREAMFIEEEEIDIAVPALFEIVAPGVLGEGSDFGMILEEDIGFGVAVGRIEKPPSGFLEELIDLDPRPGFFLGHIDPALFFPPVSRGLRHKDRKKSGENKGKYVGESAVEHRASTSSDRVRIHGNQGFVACHLADPRAGLWL